MVSFSPFRAVRTMPQAPVPDGGSQREFYPPIGFPRNVPESIHNSQTDEHTETDLTP